MPSKKENILKEISCEKSSDITWDNNNWNFKMVAYQENDVCKIVFKSSNVAKIINQLDTTGKCPTMNDDGSMNVSGTEATNGYLCKAKDAYGNSYYYRGNVTNNYVYFAGFYWRIVRTNGDDTIRVIYDGTNAHTNGESSSDRQIGTNGFSSAYKDNAYVGYMYGQTGASTYAAAHENLNNSLMKTYLDNWYKTNIAGTDNEKYLVDNVFCNDRSLSVNNTGTGAGTSSTNYRWYYGPWSSGGYNSSMKLMCPQKNDAFTVSDTAKGNGVLTYPISLLSMDEIILAGGWSDSNSGYYLYTDQIWWTLSPYYLTYYNQTYWADMRSVTANGSFGNNGVTGPRGVRPVLNLTNDILKNGDGTLKNPYHLSENE